MKLTILLTLFAFALANQPEQPSIGYKGPATPTCADGTIYATDKSTCVYPSLAINTWLQRNSANYAQLFSSVAVQTVIPDAPFPKNVVGKESCDFVEDYPLIQWVFSPELGWAPVIQTDAQKQYFRIEACTSGQCNAACGGTGNCASRCRTFHTRQRVLVWNGQDVVSTVVLLPYACKCVIESNRLPGLPEPVMSDFSSTCDPYTDCSCPCAVHDSACVAHRIRTNTCHDDSRDCNPYFDCDCHCSPGDLNCIGYRARHHPCEKREECSAFSDCDCPCPHGDFKCVSFRFASGICKDSRDDTCNPYLSCECECVVGDYSCVSYRLKKGVCLGRLERFAPVERRCDPLENCDCRCEVGDYRCVRERRDRNVCHDQDREFGELFFLDRDDDRRRHHHDEHRRRHHEDRDDDDDDRRRHRRHDRHDDDRHGNDRNDDDWWEWENDCDCDSAFWGPWCKDPSWKCLSETQRLNRIDQLKNHH